MTLWGLTLSPLPPAILGGSIVALQLFQRHKALSPDVSIHMCLSQTLAAWLWIMEEQRHLPGSVPCSTQLEPPPCSTAVCKPNSQSSTVRLLACAAVPACMCPDSGSPRVPTALGHASDWDFNSECPSDVSSDDELLQ